LIQTATKPKLERWTSYF